MMLRYVFLAASVASDAQRHTQTSRAMHSYETVCLERPMRLTQRVKREVQIDARLFLNIDAVDCGYLRYESNKGVLHFKTNTP